MFIITGGGSGIGQALAFNLAQRGQKVLIIGRNQAHLQQTAANSPLIDYLVADVTLEDDRLKIMEYVQSQPLSGLVHNAGIIEPITAIETITQAQLRLIMATNVEAPLLLTNKLFQQLQNARVLNIGSGAAHFPIPTWAAYCVSKAALAMLTRCWQIESLTMHVASVMPGIIDTPMQDLIRHASLMDAQKRDFFQRLKDQRQLISCATVASFLTWLLLDVDAASFVAQEWDIYDQTHHDLWLKPPHVVPVFE